MSVEALGRIMNYPFPIQDRELMRIIIGIVGINGHAWFYHWQRAARGPIKTVLSLFNASESNPIVRKLHSVCMQIGGGEIVLREIDDFMNVFERFAAEVIAVS